MGVYVCVCAKQEEQRWWWWVFFWVAVLKEWMYVCVHAFVSEYFWAFARRARSAYTSKNPWKFIRTRRLLSITKNTEEDSWRQEREGEEEEDDVRRAGECCTRGHHARVSLFKLHSQSHNLLWSCVRVSDRCVRLSFQASICGVSITPHVTLCGESKQDIGADACLKSTWN